MHQCPECHEPWQCMRQRVGQVCARCEPWQGRANHCPGCNWYWRMGRRNPRTGVKNDGGGFTVIRARARRRRQRDGDGDKAAVKGCGG